MSKDTRKRQFKIGDIVRCTGKGKTSEGYESSGWKKDLVFKIKSISGNGNQSIYWPAFNDHGVYEENLQLASPGSVRLSDIIAYEIGALQDGV